MGQRSKRRRNGNRAIVYARQSTYREESISLELQHAAAERHCTEHGYRVVETIDDPGISGLEFDKRPGIREAIALVQRDEADVIVVWELSRISREEFDQVFIDREVERVGGRIESATEPNGWESKKLNQFLSALDSKQKARRWKEAQARRVSRGLPGGGAPPLGYAHDGHDRAFVPDPVYGPVVVEMYDMYLRGVGPAGIAKVLTKRGLSTPRGKPFGVPTIARALDSGFAAGYITRHEDRVRGAHEPLIDDATWQAYLVERGRRRVVNPKSRQPKWFLGAGLAVCGRCGKNLVVDSYRSRKSQAICSTYRNTPGECAGTWVDRVKLETLVALWLGWHIEEWAQAAEAMVGTADDERVELARVIDRARADEARVRDGLRRAAGLVATGDMTDEDYADAKGKADARLKEIAQRLEEAQTRLEALDPAGDAYDRLARALGRANGMHTVKQPVNIAPPAIEPPAGWVDRTVETWPTEDVPAMPPEEWHALLRKIIKRIIVNEQTVVIEPWNGEPTRYDRAVVMRPRKRSDVQVRDEKGRFVKSAA